MDGAVFEKKKKNRFSSCSSVPGVRSNNRTESKVNTHALKFTDGIPWLRSFWPAINLGGQSCRFVLSRAKPATQHSSVENCRDPLGLIGKLGRNGLENFEAVRVVWPGTETATADFVTERFSRFKHDSYHELNCSQSV